MTPEQKRIAIAKACGWTHYHLDLWVPPGTEDFSELDCDSLPDYLNDLDAMHEAENIQRKKDPLWWKGYSAALYHTYGVSATAEQRADAFIATLNLQPHD